MHQILASVAILLPTVASVAAPVDFNREILPILATQCYTCHGPDEKSRKADLRLDSRPNALAGKAIVPGKPEESPLFQRITSNDSEEVMPPPRSKKPSLTVVQVSALRRWIVEGANYSDHWAFTPVVRPNVPKVVHPAFPIQTPVDAFILDRLAREKVTPSPDADRITLLRRLSFDLTGLPPTPDEVRAFVADKSPTAYERVVDRLLASPHFGERMGVHWLDLVRYADTIGYHSDNVMNVSPYRDYVIRAFNENKPFDRFTIEQLAGDLLPKPTQEQIVATAYNRLLQTTEEGGAQAKEYEAKNSADRVRNFGQVWLGGTLMCAECHNHKFDPYTQADFYAVAAFFADVQEAAIGKREAGLAVPTTEQQKALAEAKDKLQSAMQHWDSAVAAVKLPDDVKLPAALNKPLGKSTDLSAKGPLPLLIVDKTVIEWIAKHAPTLKKPFDALGVERKRFAAIEATIPRVLVTTSGPPRTVRMLARGNWQDTTGEKMNARTPSFLPKLPAKPQAGYDRLDLAKWTVSPENPLTARVFVNRTWKLFFGRGISASLEESGTQGQPPTHPELLDWLAVEFASDWDVKKLIRTMVLSQTYRRSSDETLAIRERDPANQLFARQGRSRLDAEFIRDNVLAISGLLVPTVGGPSVKPYQPAGYWAALNFPAREWQKDTGEKVYRRGLYTHWQRSFLHPAMLAFDAPSREDCTCDRPRSNIPQQALVLLNDPEFVEAARAFAAKALAENLTTDADRIAWVFSRATSRTPLPSEVTILTGLLTKHRKEFTANPEAAKQLLSIGDAPVPTTVAPAELAAWANVCRTVLNLHETMTRP